MLIQSSRTNTENGNTKDESTLSSIIVCMNIVLFAMV